MPENVLKVALKELNRLKQMTPQVAEYQVLRNYIELIADLPWNKSTNETIDIKKAKQVIRFYVNRYKN